MMDGFGFPVSAGYFRFRAEVRIVQRLLCGIEHTGPALDLGSGVGYWAQEFARSFSRVDAIEGSNPLPGVEGTMRPAFQHPCHTR